MNSGVITIYTIGHSNRTLDDFLRLLMDNDIKSLVDVRSYPYSSRFPHFSINALREVINAQKIGYHWAGRQLGGKREPKNAQSHPALTSDRLRGFAEYIETKPFGRAIAQIINLASHSKTAILCAEKLPAHCHRSLISDYLSLQHNTNVMHIVDSENHKEHELNPLARRKSKRLVYDRNVTSSLKLH